MTPSKTETC